MTTTKTPELKKQDASPSDLHARFVALNGWESQLRQLAEETSELFVALNHVARGRHDRWRDISKEVADVRTLLDQVPHIVSAICDYWGFNKPSAAEFDKNVCGHVRRNKHMLRERLAEEEGGEQ